MKKINNEFIVGLFVIFSIVGLLYLTFSTGKVQLNKEGYYIYVVFNDAAGLQKNAPVMINGFEVGKINDIRLSYNNNKTEIMFRLYIDKNARIMENPVVSIKTLGLMGEKYIQITAKEGKDYVKPETVLYGKPFVDLDTLMDQAQVITRDISQEVNKLVISLNSTVDNNKGNVDNILKNLESASKNFEEFSRDIKSHPWKLLTKTKDDKKTESRR